MGALTHLARAFHQPRFTLVRALGKAALTFVIGEILIVSVVFGDTVAACGFIDIPAHKVHSVGEFIAVGSAPTRGGDIVLPGSIQCLAVTIGGGRPRSGDKTEIPGSGWLRIGLESGFMVDDGQ